MAKEPGENADTDGCDDNRPVCTRCCVRCNEPVPEGSFECPNCGCGHFMPLRRANGRCHRPDRARDDPPKHLPNGIEFRPLRSTEEGVLSVLRGMIDALRSETAALESLPPGATWTVCQFTDPKTKRRGLNALSLTRGDFQFSLRNDVEGKLAVLCSRKGEEEQELTVSWLGVQVESFGSILCESSFGV
jgi:hypothetical protein